MPTPWGLAEGNTGCAASARRSRIPRGHRPRACTETLCAEPGDPASACGRESRRPHREVEGRKPMMNGRGKSDSSIVPAKSPNKAEGPAAEAMEGRGLAKGNSPE